MGNHRHNYEYDIDPFSHTAPANVLRLVGREKRVLEIGCGPGSITKILAREGSCKVTGLEVDPEAIKIVAPYCENIIQADLNSAEWPQLLHNFEPFDVVVAADVLEHLYDPWAGLKRMVPFINSSGYLVISLPHVGHASIAACLISGDFAYQDWGLLDRTHIRFFGLKNMEQLFTQAGLKIIDAKYVLTTPEESELSVYWSQLSAAMKVELNSCPHSHVYQVVIKAVPINRPGKKIKLLPPLKKMTTLPFKRRLSAKLNPQLKQLIRRNLERFGINV